MLRVRTFLQRAAVAALVPLAGLASQRAHAVERASLEAAIVYNLLQFVEWPGEAAQPAGAPVLVCLDAASPLLAELQSLEGRPVRRMKFAVRGVGAGDAPKACNALYVDAEGQRKGLLARKGALATGPVLVIGGIDAAQDDGLTVRLAESSGRIVFDIDMKSAREAGLVVSSRLLRLARKVTE
jgi:hypothetical protein